MRSRFTRVLLLLIAVAVVLVAADDKFSGTRKLNLAKSKYTPASAAPKSVTIKYDATADGLTASAEGTDAEGKPTSTRYSAKYDGKDVPYEGGGPLGADTIALKRVNNSTIEATMKRGGKAIGTSKRVVSRDGKAVTITTTGTNAKGEKVESVAVFEKQ
jgi:hypothetical protein